MSFITYDIKSSCKEDLKTEIIYTVKGAYVANQGIVVLRFVADMDWEIWRERITKIFKALKRQRMIEFFAQASELESGETMEAVYLLNKYPDITETVDTKGRCIIVKL